MQLLILVACALGVAVAEDPSVHRRYIQTDLNSVYGYAGSGNAHYAGASNNPQTLGQREYAHDRRWGSEPMLAAWTDNMKQTETDLIGIVGSPDNRQKISNKPAAPGWVYVRKM